MLKDNEYYSRTMTIALCCSFSSIANKNIILKPLYQNSSYNITNMHLGQTFNFISKTRSKASPGGDQEARARDRASPGANQEVLTKGRSSKKVRKRL